MGRVTKQTRPWGDGGKQMTRNVYAANSIRFYDNRPIKVYTDYEDASGKFLNLAVTDYTYEDSAEVERVTATTYAAGVNHQQVTIDETYGEAAAYAYAVGKPKFSQAVNGVQTWYAYEATTEHGAIHKHTVITKANGELVAAQSRKTESFLAEDETTIFTQESIWDGTQWLVLNTTAYEYDDEQRVTKRHAVMDVSPRPNGCVAASCVKRMRMVLPPPMPMILLTSSLEPTAMRYMMD